MRTFIGLRHPNVHLENGNGSIYLVSTTTGRSYRRSALSPSVKRRAKEAWLFTSVNDRNVLFIMLHDM